MPALVAFLGKGNLDAVPSLRDAFGLLAKDGFTVEVVAPRDGAFSQIDDASGFSQTVLPCPLGGGLLRRCLNYVRVHRFLVRRREKWRGAIALGVDPEGLILANLALPKRPIGYVSLEVYCPGRAASLQERILKQIERRMYRRAGFVLIQDRERAALLAEVNGGEVPVMLLPNGTSGGLDSAPSDLLRSRLGILPEQRIILHIGSVEAWTQCREIIRAAETWPTNWVLVVQCRKRPDDAFLDATQTVSRHGTKVIVLSNPVPSGELGELVRGADVGLAFYQPVPGHTILGRNLECLGASSGKVAQYFKAGVPVVSANLPSLQRIIGPYEPGLAVSGPTEARDAIAAVLAERERFSAGAQRCFLAEFAIEPHVHRLADRLRELASSQPHRG